jgi:hypothetical protein
MNAQVSTDRRDFRRRIGLPTQQLAKKFFGARDLEPEIDLRYVGVLTLRVSEIVRKVHASLHASCQWPDINEFCARFVQKPSSQIVSSGLLGSMNNQGRRPEEVLFSWLRGYALMELFTPALAQVFSVPVSGISRIGDDDFSNPETFRRTARADLGLMLGGKKFRVEVQTGFQGVNDIKEHKVKEARSAWEQSATGTICAHFDIYNGLAALVELHRLEIGGPGWVTRTQMEGQRVLAIAEEHFTWDLRLPPPAWPTAESRSS